MYEQPVQLERVRLCFDERPCQPVDDVVAPLPTKPSHVAKEDNEYVRKSTCVILLAYDLDTGQRFVQVRKQRTKADYPEFMHVLVGTHYADAELVEVINTHKYRWFYEHLPLEQARALSRQIAFHFTPKYGLWLNAAEIEFSALTRQCFNRRVDSLGELGRQVSLWISERNERAVKPGRRSGALGFYSGNG